jgi:hypothetical protein
MEQFPPSEEQDLRKTLKNFLTAQSFKTQQQKTCPRCGAAMRFVDLVLSLNETDSGWNLHLPFCLCTESSPSLSVAKRGVRYEDWT